MFFGDECSRIKFTAHHIWPLKNPFRDGWKSPLLPLGSCVLHQTQISGITLREPSHKWISCCVWSLIGESVHHVAICLRTSSLRSHFPRNQHPVVWITLGILSSAAPPPPPAPHTPIQVCKHYQHRACCAWSLQTRQSSENIADNAVPKSLFVPYYHQ